MPELPEVEIHARNLRAWLEGRVIRGCEVLDPKLQSPSAAAPLPAALWERQVLRVRRLAKYLLVDLDDAATLVAHLRMTGRFVRDTYIAGPAGKPTRLCLELDTGERVRFEDTRRFGRVWTAPTARVTELSELTRVGPDALLEPIAPERLDAACRRTGRSIKALLMDQSLLGGLGNICAIELLFRAGIAPATPARSLTQAQVTELALDIPRYLEWAIDAQSRRELVYLGEKGAENVFPIYRRQGEPCPRCETPIRYGA